VALGGQLYPVRRMPAMKAIAWRKRAAPIVDTLQDLAEKYGASGDNLIGMAGALLHAADGLMGEMIEVVIVAGPELEADRKHIEEAAFEEEYLEAFQSILLLNAPLAGAAHSITASTGDSSGTI
jgi:hypothetical protein